MKLVLFPYRMLVTKPILPFRSLAASRLKQEMSRLMPADGGGGRFHSVSPQRTAPPPPRRMNSGGGVEGSAAAWARGSSSFGYSSRLQRESRGPTLSFPLSNIYQAASLLSCYIPSLSQRYFAREAERQDEMADSEGKTAKTRSNTEGVRVRIELDPVVAGRGGDTLYSFLCDFFAGVDVSRLQEASRNSSRNLRLWTRRGGSIRALFVISVGTITFLALPSLLIFLCFLFTTTLSAVIVSLLVSLVAAGGFLAFFFTCSITICIGTLSIAAFAISTATISTIIAIMVATGWIGFFWVIWLVAKKSLGLTSQSVSKASSVISTYSNTWQTSEDAAPSTSG